MIVSAESALEFKALESFNLKPIYNTLPMHARKKIQDPGSFKER